MSAKWTVTEVMKLIEIWGKQGIQEQLEGSKRNKHVYTMIFSELVKYGIGKFGEK